jgi:hypothetical protein
MRPGGADSDTLRLGRGPAAPAAPALAPGEAGPGAGPGVGEGRLGKSSRRRGMAIAPRAAHSLRRRGLPPEWPGRRRRGAAAAATRSHGSGLSDGESLTVRTDPGLKLPESSKFSTHRDDAQPERKGRLPAKLHWPPRMTNRMSRPKFLL